MKIFTKMSIIGILIIYLLISYVYLNINLLTWNHDTRVIFVILVTGWIVICGIIATAIINK
jgi:hypothetical protein